MPFDPGKGSSNGYGNYANPYAPKPPSPQNNKKGPSVAIFIAVGVLVLGFIFGGIVFMSKNMTQAPPNGSGSVVDDSKYVEVEIFDVKKSESSDSATQ